MRVSRRRTELSGRASANLATLKEMVLVKMMALGWQQPRTPIVTRHSCTSTCKDGGLKLQGVWDALDNASGIGHTLLQGGRHRQALHSRLDKLHTIAQYLVFFHGNLSERHALVQSRRAHGDSVMEAGHVHVDEHHAQARERKIG
jgi:hypothetical protein